MRKIEQVTIEVGRLKLPTRIQENDVIIWYRSKGCISFMKNGSAGRRVYFDSNDDKRFVSFIATDADFLDFCVLLASLLGLQLESFAVSGGHSAYKFVK